MLIHAKIRLLFGRIRFLNMNIDHGAKEIADIAAASTAVMSLMSWLPPTASLLTIIWMLIRIYESDTVQELLGKKK